MTLLRCQHRLDLLVPQNHVEQDPAGLLGRGFAMFVCSTTGRCPRADQD